MNTMHQRKFKFSNSIFVKFTLTFIVVGLLPLFAFSYISFGAFFQHIEKYTIVNFEQMLDYAGKNIHDIIVDYNNITKLIYSYQTNDYGDLGDLLQNTTNQSQGKGQYVKKSELLINQFLRYMLYTDRNIKNIFLITKNNKLYYQTKETKQLNVTYSFAEKSWYKQLHHDKKSLAIIATHQEEYFTDSDLYMFGFARNYMDLTSVESVDNKILGTIVLDVEIKVLDNIFNQIDLGDNGEIYIVTGQGQCVYSSDFSQVSKKLKWYPVHKKNNEYTVGTFEQNNTYIITVPITDTDWTIVGKVYQSDIRKKVFEIRDFILFIIFLCIILLSFIAIVFSRLFSNPVKKIIGSMKKVQEGNLNEKVVIHSEDEIGQLAEGFNNMVTELKSYINKAYVASIKQREAELDALKGQIKPHYLYNTLEVIRMNAICNEDMEVAEMIDALSGQLKYLIGYREDIVTIRQEINNIKNYFKLFAIRYGNRYELEIRLSDEILSLGILKLTLQPIVENAVIHGLKPKEGKGKVMITATLKDNAVEISVFDDGVGIAQNVLARIEKGLASDNNDNSKQNHDKYVGLRNVQDRIQLYFGKLYGLEIKSHQNIGSVVKLIIPIVKDVKQNDQGFTG